MFYSENTICGNVTIQTPEPGIFTQLSYVVVSLGVIVSLLGNLFIYYYRDTGVILVSQPNLLHSYCAGFVLLNLSGIPRTLNSYAPFSQVWCVTRIWFVYPALAFIIAVLTAKEWKTWKIRVNSLKLRKFNLPENLLILYLVLCVGLVLIVLAFWTAFQPPKVDPCQNFECNVDSSASFWVMNTIQIIQTLLMLLVAWKNRNMGKIGGEPKGILVTAISLFVLVIVFFVSSLYGSRSDVEKPNQSNQSNAIEALISYIFCFLVTCVSVGAVIFNKYRSVDIPKEEILSMFLTTPYNRTVSMKQSTSNDNNTHRTSTSNEDNLLASEVDKVDEIVDNNDDCELLLEESTTQNQAEKVETKPSNDAKVELVVQ